MSLNLQNNAVYVKLGVFGPVGDTGQTGNTGATGATGITGRASFDCDFKLRPG